MQNKLIEFDDLSRETQEFYFDILYSNPLIEYYPALKVFRKHISECMKSDYPNGDCYFGSDLRDETEAFNRKIMKFACRLIVLS